MHTRESSFKTGMKRKEIRRIRSSKRLTSKIRNKKPKIPTTYHQVKIIHEAPKNLHFSFSNFLSDLLKTTYQRYLWLVKVIARFPKQYSKIGVTVTRLSLQLEC